MVWVGVYVAVWVSPIIYHNMTIDRREGETSYIDGYFNILDNSSAWAGISVIKSEPTDVLKPSYLTMHICYNTIT
jgi:hypothetical protein